MPKSSNAPQNNSSERDNNGTKTPEIEVKMGEQTDLGVSIFDRISRLSPENYLKPFGYNDKANEGRFIVGVKLNIKYIRDAVNFLMDEVTKLAPIKDKKDDRIVSVKIRNLESQSKLTDEYHDISRLAPKGHFSAFKFKPKEDGTVSIGIQVNIKYVREAMDYLLEFFRKRYPKMDIDAESQTSKKPEKTTNKSDVKEETKLHTKTRTRTQKARVVAKRAKRQSAKDDLGSKRKPSLNKGSKKKPRKNAKAA